MVSIWQAIVLGVVQGLTEFLPVSSSGHLVIFQNLLNISEPVLAFDSFLHVGTLVAVFFAFWDDIKELLRHPFSRLMALLAVGTVPVVIMGVFLQDIFEAMFASLLAVCLALVLTGILMFVSDKMNGEKSLKDLSLGGALLVGFFQGLAITPGLSRSGSTIFGALLGGIRRDEAAKFAFLLSIPAILGAACFQFLELLQENTMTFQFSYLVGMIVSAVVGYFAIRIFLNLLKKRNMRYFAYYCWTLAIVVLIVKYAL